MVKAEWWEWRGRKGFFVVVHVLVLCNGEKINRKKSIGLRENEENYVVTCDGEIFFNFLCTIFQSAAIDYIFSYKCWFFQKIFLLFDINWFSQLWKRNRERKRYMYSVMCISEWLNYSYHTLLYVHIWAFRYIIRLASPWYNSMSLYRWCMNVRSRVGMGIMATLSIHKGSSSLKQKRMHHVWHSFVHLHLRIEAIHPHSSTRPP